MKKTGSDSVCEHCGKSYYVPGWRLKQKEPVRFCSMKCMWAGRKRRNQTRFQATCERCDKIYLVEGFRVGKTRFCSKACHGSAWFVEAAEARLAGNRSKPKMSQHERRIAKKKWDADDHHRHRDARIAKSKQRYHENRKEIRAMRKQWAKEHPEIITEWNRRRRARHGDKIRAKRHQHYCENKSVYVANARKREKHIKQATPPWANLKAIEAFYVLAAKLTEETGIKYHVDHIYPLKSKIMCGLHVETNLQVIPAKVNLRKSNLIVDFEGLMYTNQ